MVVKALKLMRLLSLHFLSHEKMEHDSNDHDDTASSLVARGNWKDIGLSNSIGEV